MADPADQGAARSAAARTTPKRALSPSRSDQYFEASPQADHAPRRLAETVAGMKLSFFTDSGVFSPTRLDPGTKLLLLEAPPLGSDDRRVLDLGCGWGAIACVTALRYPHVEVTAIDVNERARKLTALNAEANGALNVAVRHPEDVDAGIAFDRILSNPPIRVGKPALRSLLGEWLDRLRPGGAAHLVVHRHLGSDSLAQWLTSRGHEVRRLLSRTGYRILEVRCAPAPPGDAPRLRR